MNEHGARRLGRGRRPQRRGVVDALKQTGAQVNFFRGNRGGAEPALQDQGERLTGARQLRASLQGGGAAWSGSRRLRGKHSSRGGGRVTERGMQVLKSFCKTSFHFYIFGQFTQTLT